VALFTMGRIPIRKNHLGTFPAPAWSADYQWSGYVPYESLPSQIGSAGVLANGNNLMLPPERSGELRQIDGAPAYRHTRIRQQLEQIEEHTATHSLDLQLDSYVLRGQRVTPHLLKDLAGLDSPSTLEQSARNLLADWDFNSGADSAGAAVFFAVYREAGLAALRDEVESEGLEFIMSMPYPTFPFDDWFESPEHPAWDDLSTPEVETRPDTVRHSFQMAVHWLSKTMGDDPKEWRWGRVHDRHFKHPFGGRKLLEELVNMPRSDAAGAFETVNKAHFNMSDPGHPFRSFAGAALRMVIDLGDIHNARWVLDTGQSGWPGAQNYSNQYHLWSQGTTMAMISDWERVRSEAVGVLSLQPGQ
jgi:penicillin G amidase